MSVLPSKNYLHREKWPGYFLEIVACLPCLLLSLSHQATSVMIPHSWLSVKHSLHPWGRGEPVQHHGNCSWLNVPPNSHWAVFQTTVKSPGQHTTTGEALFSIGKRPCLPNHSLNESSPSIHAKTEVKFCLSLAGISFPPINAHLPLGHREQKAKLFAIMYLKCVNKITLEWVHIPSDLAFHQQPSKYVPWQECLLRQ